MISLKEFLLNELNKSLPKSTNDKVFVHYFSNPYTLTY